MAEPLFDMEAAALAHSISKGPSAAPAPELFQRLSSRDLAAPVGPVAFLVRKVLAKPTYGMIAGELKTLKSHVALALAMSVASGQDFLGEFPVRTPHPVLMYIGEGGKTPFQRRFQHFGQNMGLVLNDLPLEASFDVASIDSPRFRQSLARDLDDLQPGLVIIDPYYAFHGTNTSAANLHEEGALLAGLSAQCMAAGASLMIVNHFNQTGSGTGLKRITMSGSGEWVDSWILLSHQEKPDVTAGKFLLNMEIGSRQWGGASHTLSWDLGPFNDDTGTCERPWTWSVDDARASQTSLEQQVVKILGDEPWIYSATGLADRLGGNDEKGRAVIKKLLQDNRIEQRQVASQEGDRQVKRARYGLPGAQLAPTARRG